MIIEAFRGDLSAKAQGTEDAEGELFALRRQNQHR